MRSYHYGSKAAPVILMLPGTCCHWKRNSGEVILLLEQEAVLYDLVKHFD